MGKPRSLEPICLGGGRIEFSLLEGPKQVLTTVKITNAPVYLDGQNNETFVITSTRATRRTDFFVDENGNKTSNRWADGVDQTQENMREVWVEDIVRDREVHDVPVFWTEEGTYTTVDTGDPVITIGSMYATQTLLCKERDHAGNRMAHPGDPLNPIGPWSGKDLTMQEIKALHKLFYGGTINETFDGFLPRVASQNELYATPAEADAAELLEQEEEE